MKELVESFENTRALTSVITAPLFVEDYCIQSMKDVSPPKWHLGHTTWYFEVFLLEKFQDGYKSFNKDLHPVFNSYYDSLGKHWPQAERGALSRPSVKEVNDYRQHVDLHMLKALQRGDDLPSDLISLGLHHEQQHQELLYMDIKHILFQQHHPQKYWGLTQSLPILDEAEFIHFPGGLIHIGHQGDAFAFDNEGPHHPCFVNPFSLCSELVSNRDFLDFIESGAYENPDLWYAEGWDWVQHFSPKHPLYWCQQDDTWFEYDLTGLKELVLDRPVCHVNFYEAAAFARYANKRLPTEFEWEYAAQTASEKLNHLFDSLWQWTASAYQPYPGHQWKKGPLGEYNTKFMINQIVLRGGSAWTPPDHLRTTYRNFYHPQKNWAFTGIRLAKDPT